MAGSRHCDPRVSELHNCMTHSLPRIDKLPHTIHGGPGKKDSLVVFFVSYAIIVDLFNDIDIIGV